MRCSYCLTVDDAEVTFESIEGQTHYRWWSCNYCGRNFLTAGEMTAQPHGGQDSAMEVLYG